MSEDNSNDFRKSPIDNKMQRIDTLPLDQVAAFSGNSIAMASKSSPSAGAFKQRATPIGGVKIKESNVK